MKLSRLIKTIEVFILFLLIAGGIYFHTFPIFRAFQVTPPSDTYLGTLIHPDDYFYYLSQFAQGKDSWFFSYDLYTSESTQKVIIGWVNVLLGKVFYLAGFNQIIAYSGSVVIFKSLVIIFSCFFVYAIQRKKQRLLATIIGTYIGVFSNSFSLPVFQSGVLTFKPYDYWSNFGNPIMRFTDIPHQLIIWLSIMIIFLISISYYESHLSTKKMILYSLMLLVLSFILGSLQPLQWVIIGLVLAIFATIQMVKNSGGISFKRTNVAQKIEMYLPVLLVFFGGFPPAFVLQRLFTMLPYTQMVTWEKLNSPIVSVSLFVLATGPILILTCFSVLVLYKHLLRPRIFLPLIYCLITIAAFISTLPTILGMQNLRFLSPAMFPFMGGLCALGITSLAQKYSRFSVRIYITVLLLFSSIIIPTYAAEAWMRPLPDVGNAYLYLRSDFVEAMEKAYEISQPTDIFAVMWPFHESFPAFARRRIYTGHPLLTINSEQKNLENYHFFSSIESPAEQEEFLRKNHIAYVFAEPWEYKTLKITNIQPVYKNSAIWIYKVVDTTE